MALWVGVALGVMWMVMVMSKYSARNSPSWQAQRLRVLERDGYVCIYCGKDLVGDDATVDHIESVSETGRDSDSYMDDELLSCCRSCNSSKGARALTRLYYVNEKWFDV